MQTCDYNLAFSIEYFGLYLASLRRTKNIFYQILAHFRNSLPERNRNHQHNDQLVHSNHLVYYKWVDLVSQVMVGIWDRAELKGVLYFEW